MSGVEPEILQQVIAATREPVLVVRVDQPDWPIVLSNPAFFGISEDDVIGAAFADVVEKLMGRAIALEVSETIRVGQENSLPVESHGREYLVVLKPLVQDNGSKATYYGAFWRLGAGGGGIDGAEAHHALLKAKRRIRDLSRDDPVTGLLNQRAFTEVFEHDWSVAARDGGQLSIVVFKMDDFDDYLDVFGRHASDSCLRRVGLTIRRCLRRASDVIARIDTAGFVVLSHAAEEPGVQSFAANISTAVRELGLHHPRSKTAKFVTVSYSVYVAKVNEDSKSANEFLIGMLAPGKD